MWIRSSGLSNLFSIISARAAREGLGFMRKRKLMVAMEAIVPIIMKNVTWLMFPNTNEAIKFPKTYELI